MISTDRRINAFTNLGNYITNPDNQDTIDSWIAGAKSKNNWFTPENITLSLKAIATEYLDSQKLTSWAASYPAAGASRKVGVVMAGNIPAVGFHDAMCVLISGHTLLAKLSSDDRFLMLALLNQLIEIEPAFKDYIQFAERLNDADAYIATGSDNTARYFHYYFSKKPNIVRKNRTSVAVLTGGESDEELIALGRDILQYFGLGCRNVSTVFVPEGYDFTALYEAIQSQDDKYRNHHKFFNNYEYNKSIFLVNRVPHLDNGFLLLNESTSLVSPISVLHYQTYRSRDELNAQIDAYTDNIQCVVGDREVYKKAVPFGEAQQPGLSDYADGVDTMAFLSTL